MAVAPEHASPDAADLAYEFLVFPHVRGGSLEEDLVRYVYRPRPGQNDYQGTIQTVASGLLENHPGLRPIPCLPGSLGAYAVPDSRGGSQLHFGRTGIAVRVPHWVGAEATKAALRQAWRLLEEVATATGWAVFDWHADRLVDLDRDFDTVLNSIAAEKERAVKLFRERPAAEPPKRWWRLW